MGCSQRGALRGTGPRQEQRPRQIPGRRQRQRPRQRPTQRRRPSRPPRPRLRQRAGSRQKAKPLLESRLLVCKSTGASHRTQVAVASLRVDWRTSAYSSRGRQFASRLAKVSGLKFCAAATQPRLGCWHQCGRGGDCRNQHTRSSCRNAVGLGLRDRMHLSWLPTDFCGTPCLSDCDNVCANKRG